MFDFNKDYLYHSVYGFKRENIFLNSLKLQNILKSGYILSRRNIFYEICNEIPYKFNSNDYDYISLSKKVSNNSNLDKISIANKTKLLHYEIYTILAEIKHLPYHHEAYYKYALLHPTFIFNTNIGEIETNLILSNDFTQYIDKDKRYSDLIGEYQIKNSIDINKAVAISLPYEIEIFYLQLLKKLDSSLDFSNEINEIKKLTLERINLIEKYLPNTPIVDISSKKILTKSMFNDII